MLSWIAFWDSLGWLANAIAVITGFVALWALLPRAYRRIVAMKSNRKFKNVGDYVKDRVSVSTEVMRKIKQIAKIAIVDDNLADFPVDYLRRAGFHVDLFTEISLAETSKLAHYDVIFLDIVGVVVEDKRAGGLDLIRRLRTMDTRPSVIAVSGKKFDPTVTDFFKQADDVMNKPITETICEQHIRDMLEQRLSPIRAAWDIDKLLGESNLSADEYGAVVKKLIAYIQGSGDRARVNKDLGRKYGLQELDRIVWCSDKVRKWFEQ
jgi:CheY-like chemotaxis protein